MPRPKKRLLSLKATPWRDALRSQPRLIYEKDVGSISFLKRCQSAVNRVIVAKGACTPDELAAAFAAEVYPE